MQLSESVNKVDSSFGAGQRLTIAATATAMKVLSKNLYSDPIRAVLREVGTNAADAMISAGLGDKPFEVYLPTYANPVLRIRDYGNGIPPDKVIDIFATYFSSTKTHDNSVTGCLGLGSKSPLAVADQFTVEIWFEGFYYVWNIYKDEDSFPAIPGGKPSLIEPTTEPTGVQITVPVSNTSRFEEMAKEVYQSFSPIPNVYKGQVKLDIKPPVIKTKYPSCYFQEGTGIYALMGNILYPINPTISGLESYSDLGYYNKVIIPFAIGELSFSASRESLEYDKRVINVLRNKYKQIASEFAVEIQKKVDEQENAFKATFYFNSVVAPHKVKQEMRKIVTYKGALLSSYYGGTDRANYDISVMKQSKTDAYGYTYAIGYPLMKIDTSKRKYSNAQNLNISDRVKIYYNDKGEKKGLVSRLSYLSNSSQDIIYLLSEDVDVDKWLTLNHLTKDDIYKVSEVAKVPTDSTYEARRRAGVFKIKGGNIQKDFWQPLDELPDFAYYVVKSGDKIVIDGKEKFTDKWDRFLTLDIFPTDAPIYGVSKSYLKNFNDWTILDEPLLPAMELKREELELALSNQGSSFMKLIEFWPKGAFKDKLLLIEKNLQNIGTWQNLYQMYNVPLESKASLRIDEEVILKKYPMLAPLISYYNKPSAKDVQNYILEIGDVE